VWVLLRSKASSKAEVARRLKDLEEEINASQGWVRGGDSKAAADLNRQEPSLGPWIGAVKGARGFAQRLLLLGASSCTA
jgi:hypothetical protein